MRTTVRTVLVLVAAGSLMLALNACSGTTGSTTPSGSTAAASSAKSAWDDLDQKVESTQAIIPGEWEASDSGASECGTSGARWGIARLGSGASADDRARLIDQVGAAWKADGWTPTRTELGGDAPGLQLRYPAVGSLDDGFFIELGITEHGTSIQAQTPCAPGDVDALNEEQYAYNHQNTTRLPSSSPSAP
jgi:hypothetical protein